jgi:hypothetical protein
VTTINGQKFEAFPDTGNPYGADTSALPVPGFQLSMLLTVSLILLPLTDGIK